MGGTNRCFISFLADPVNLTLLIVRYRYGSPNSTNVDTSIIANNNWTTSKQATSDSQGNLRDFGLGLSVLACTASSAAAANPGKYSSSSISTTSLLIRALIGKLPLRSENLTFFFFFVPTVKVSLPENTIEDFPNPADKIQSRKWSVYNEPPSDPDHLNNSLFRFPDMLNP